MRKSTVLLAAVSAVPFFAFDRLVQATPYASQVSSDGNNVSFYLNQGANDVVVMRDGVPQDLGGLGAGQQSFALQGAANYQIIVKNAALPGYNYFAGAANFAGGTIATGGNNIISSATGVTTARGAAVNQDPTSPYFGRIYLSLGGMGVGYTNPDLSNPQLPDNGVAWNGASSPLRLTIGPGNNVYASDWSDPHSGIFVMDPNLNNGTTVLAGIGDSNDAPGTPSVHGSIPSRLILSGSPATGDFKILALDEDLSYLPGTTTPHSYSQTGTAGSGGTLDTDPPPPGATYQSMWEWDLGSASTNYNTPPVKVTDWPTSLKSFHGTTNDIARGPTGKFYMMIDRSAGTDDPSLTVLDPTAKNTLWDSKSTSAAVAGTTVPDFLRNSDGIVVSPDGKFLVLSSLTTGTLPGAVVVPLDANGIPILSEARVIPIGGTPNGRDVAIDAAGNIIETSSGSGGSAFEIGPGGLTQTVYSNNAAGTAGAFTSAQLSPTWTSPSTGNYSDPSQWLLSYVPNMTGLGALFGSAITADTAINLDTNVMLGSISFDNAHKYTLSSSGGNNITLSTFDPAGAQVSVLSGSHEIATPVTLGNNTTVNVASAASVMTFSGDITTSGSVSFTTTGLGTTKVKSLNVGALNVSSGKLQMTAARAAAATTVTRGLTVGAGATLDLGNNDLIDDYSNGGSPDATLLGTVKGLIAQGYNNGAWTGAGITSSAAAAVAANSAQTHKTGLGYAEGSTIGGSHNGTGLDNDALVIAYTYFGDADLSGTVGTNDFTALSQNFGATNATWVQGDFNYDGVVNALDFNALATNFGAASLAAPGPALGSLVPEPTSLALLGLGAATLLGRRRRSR